MNKITTIGLDLAKNVFHAVCCDQYGKQVGRKLLRRNQVLAYFAQMESCLVGMESCGSAHYWARELQKPGHQVKLIPPQYVKPYLRGNKNDYNDALAIAEAVTRPEMRFSAINTQEQQDIQALHRLRERRIQERTALCNQVRGLLAEYGLIIKVGVRSLQRKLPDLLEDAENGLSDVFRRYLIQIQQQLQELDAHIDFYNDLLQEQNRQNEACQRLQSIPGFGPVVASVFYSMIGNGENYRRGR
ncbi:IS110 family transposase, partial [Thiolapillus sp.]